MYFISLEYWHYCWIVWDSISETQIYETMKKSMKLKTILTFKTLYGLTPLYLSEMFTHSASFHDYRLRSSNMSTGMLGQSSGPLPNITTRSTMPQWIYSDNGKTFVSASKWIEQVMKDERIYRFLAQQETNRGRVLENGLHNCHPVKENFVPFCSHCSDKM